MKEEKNYRKSKNFSLEDKKEVASDAETNGVIYIYFTGGFLMREISRRLKVKKQNQSRLFLSFFFFFLKSDACNMIAWDEAMQGTDNG